VNVTVFTVLIFVFLKKKETYEHIRKILNEYKAKTSYRIVEGSHTLYYFVNKVGTIIIAKLAHEMILDDIGDSLSWKWAAFIISLSVVVLLTSIDVFVEYKASVEEKRKQLGLFTLIVEPLNVSEGIVVYLFSLLLRTILQHYLKSWYDATRLVTAFFFILSASLVTFIMNNVHLNSLLETMSLAFVTVRLHPPFLSCPSPLSLFSCTFGRKTAGPDR